MRAIGLVVFAIALVGLRELSPGLRDQLMVSARDRALIEARAAGIDPEVATRGAWRQMLGLDVFGSAFAISVFLLFYYIAVGFLVIFFATQHGYSPLRANSLANWYRIANAVALVGTGLLSDRVRVRKPFMVVGAVISAIGVGAVAVVSIRPGTGYYTFAWLLVLIAAGGEMAYCAWMASFTETVEKHDPAATATGLAVYGWTVRMVVTLSLLGFLAAVGASSVLVDKGTRVQELATRYSAELTTIGKVDPAVLGRLAADPGDQAAGATAVGQIAGVPAADVAGVASLARTDAQQLQTAAAVPLATLSALQTDPTDRAAQLAAVTAIARTLQILPAAATTRLVALAQVPPADLALLSTNGPKVQAATAQLQAVSSVPKPDLAYLQANGAQVKQAVEDSPRQWQRWWWVCFAGQIVFLPFVFVMAGRWSPCRAREDEQAHESAVQREMAALGVS